MHLAEATFWRPSGASFQRLREGDLLPFNLHFPHNFIIGGGFFTRTLLMTVSLAWSAVMLNAAGALMVAPGPQDPDQWILHSRLL
ncbi:hypothetical protein GCM10022631_25320 [Deinococcus rubellus]